MRTHSTPAGNGNVSSASAAAIVAAVALITIIPEDQILGHRRSKYIVDARHASWLALQRIGYHPAKIQRTFPHDHSTVVHGLHRAAADPILRAVATEAIELAGAHGAGRALRLWIRRLMRGLPAGDRRAIRAYCVCTLMGWERRPGVLCAHGLWIAASQPATRALLEQALLNSGLSGSIALIELQAVNAGYTGGRHQ